MTNPRYAFLRTLLDTPAPSGFELPAARAWRAEAARFADDVRADAVGNGLEALASVSARDYQLILMDLQMPEMDGFEASRQIRRMLPAERQPRIIALTANALQGDRQLCFDAGMDDYITKPLKSHDLAGAIRRQFGAHSRTVTA